MTLALLGADGGTVTEPTCCASREALKANDGKRVAVVGTYRATRIEMKKQPGKPPLHAQVDTPGGPLVLGVYYQAEGRRPGEELTRLNGKKVRVVGVLRFRPPTQTSPDGIPMASMIEPCVSPVESVVEEP